MVQVAGEHPRAGGAGKDPGATLLAPSTDGEGTGTKAALPPTSATER